LKSADAFSASFDLALPAVRVYSEAGLTSFDFRQLIFH
jgi:hypothetical protein